MWKTGLNRHICHNIPSKIWYQNQWICTTLFTASKRSLRRLCFYTCLSFCPQGGHAWQGVCMAGGRWGHARWRGPWQGGHVWQGGMHGRGGMCGRGACMAGGVCVAGGHAWQRGMHGRGCTWQGACMARGACMAGGHLWHGGRCGRGVCMAGGMCGMHTPHTDRYYEIQSMSGWYASYWNAFLLEVYWIVSTQWFFNNTFSGFITRHTLVDVQFENWAYTKRFQIWYKVQ